jgi:hypothetical protein
VGAHARAHHRRADRLGDVVDRAGLEAFHLVGRLGQGGHENHRHRRRGRMGFQRRAYFVTGHPRHHHVQQDQVGLLLARQFECARAILGKQQAVVVLQDLAQQLQVARFIVDGQDQRSGIRLVHAEGSLVASPGAPSEDSVPRIAITASR